MNKRLFIIPVAALILANSGGCGRTDSAATRQTEATRSMTDQADRSIGMPAITNFAERRLLREIYERRDRTNAATFAYTQGLDGRLVCLGNSIGYGVPYAAQFTAPMASQYLGGGHGYQMMHQPEPNGLYMPESASATWLQMVNPETRRVDVVYLEPTIVVSPFRLRGPMVAVDCPA